MLSLMVAHPEAVVKRARLRETRAIAFILMPCVFVILSDRSERRISLLYCENEILPFDFAQDRLCSAPQNDSLGQV
jgi:hypothetical protein